MKNLFYRLCFFTVLIITLPTGCSAINTVPPDPVIVINHAYEIEMSKGTINIEIENVTEEVIKDLEITVNSKTNNYNQEQKIKAIDPRDVNRISFNLDGKPYPKDLRIYVKGYYKKNSINNLFICDYPLEPFE